MLHEGVMLNRGMNGVDNRRHGERVPFPLEVLISWHHDLPTTVRYQIIDASDGGYRIRCSTPLLEGMTGMALRLLPEGVNISKPVMVVWCERSDEGAYEIGLRLF